MIEVRFDDSELRMSAKGHALSAERGRDLICAAVSTLAYTLLANVERLADEGKLIDASVELSEGRAEIYCKPKNKNRHEAECIFSAVQEGMRLLAREYPENVALQQ